MGELRLPHERLRPDRVAIVEAIIAAARAAGTLALIPGGRGVAIGTTIFEIAGFDIGPSQTTHGGAIADIAYHASMLPNLPLLAAEATSDEPRSVRTTTRLKKSGIEPI